MRATVQMVLMSLAGFALAYTALWYVGLFSGLGFHGTIAAILGVLLTTVVGTHLMALLFHSSRTHHDQHVHHSSKRGSRSPDF